VADEGGWWPLFDSPEQALDMLTEAIDHAGFDPGDEVAIALDIAASQFGAAGAYRLAGETLTTEAMVDRLAAWVERYPIVSVEDPLGEDVAAGVAAFTARVGGRVQVVGDDFLVTDPVRIAAAARDNSLNAVLLKPNQRGTLSETLSAWQVARAAGLRGIVSARSGETEDTTIVHLAIGWGVGQLKVGSITRGERTAKWNEALRIEEALGPRARFAGRAAIAR
jgi:enolase